MAELHILTKDPIPKDVFGVHSGYSIRSCRPEERISLEDKLFVDELEEELPENLVSIVFPESPFTESSVKTYRDITEFAFGLVPTKRSRRKSALDRSPLGTIF